MDVNIPPSDASLSDVPSRARDEVPGASMADISKARAMLGYAPTHSVRQGLREAMPWYLAQASLACA